jgi:hypothetical protein
MEFIQSVLALREENEVVSDHIDLILDFEELEEVVGPVSLPHRLLTDRENPLEASNPTKILYFYMTKTNMWQQLTNRGD